MSSVTKKFTYTSKGGRRSWTLNRGRNLFCINDTPSNIVRFIKILVKQNYPEVVWSKHCTSLGALANLTYYA
jgi:hypothetical protein